MITLNLLPPAKKQELRLTQLYIAVKNLIILILFLTIITAIALLLTKMTLQNYFNKIVSETTLTTKYANIFNKDIREFNQQIKAVEKIQKDYIPWTKFFINFNKLIPDNIGIDNLSLNGNQILITGLAKNRDDFLKLKDNLKNSDLFSEVVIPLENLLKKENVDFNIKTNINLDELKNYDH